MTERLYYNDSFLYTFDATVTEIIPASPANQYPAVVLDRTAFYPTSGGQVYDTGRIIPATAPGPSGGSPVRDVVERDDGTILHFVDDATALSHGTKIQGAIDVDRRRDHMQQHSGQHVLSAAFIQLFDMTTVSFHMGEDYCSIDLDAKAVTPQQVEAAEQLANKVIQEDRPVAIRYVSQEEARGLGLRKIPPVERGQLRLIDIRDFDLTACGGTHVSHTGQIGSILLRKTEKVRQGIRVEFVAGMRAIRTARRDYTALAEAAALYSAHIWDVPPQIRKAQDEAKSSRRVREQLLEEIAEQQASILLDQTPLDHGQKTVVRIFSDKDLAFIKLLAQRLTRKAPSIALLASTSGQPALVFAQSAGQPHDMGALMKDTLLLTGGRGGGSRDMAQGGPEKADMIADVLKAAAAKLRDGH